MGSILLSVVGPISDCKEFRESEAEPQLVSAKAMETVAGNGPVAPLGAEAAGGLVEIGHSPRIRAPEQKRQFADSDATSARVADNVVETRFDRVADVEIAVRDNQPVRRGQLIFRIDPEPYQIAVDQAEAQLRSARIQINSLKATYRQQQAELESAKDTAAFDEREYYRKKALVTNDYTPREVYDQTETNLKVARQHVASIEQQIANTVVALDDDPNIEINRHPTVRAAKAQLDHGRYSRASA